MTIGTRVLRCRLKDKHSKFLAAQAREVNLVWNYCNELSVKVFEREHRFISAYEIAAYSSIWSGAIGGSP